MSEKMETKESIRSNAVQKEWHVCCPSLRNSACGGLQQLPQQQQSCRRPQGRNSQQVAQQAALRTVVHRLHANRLQKVATSVQLRRVLHNLVTARV